MFRTRQPGPSPLTLPPAGHRSSPPTLHPTGHGSSPPRAPSLVPVTRASALPATPATGTFFRTFAGKRTGSPGAALRSHTSPSEPARPRPIGPAAPSAPRLPAAPTRTVYWSVCSDNPCKRSTEPLLRPPELLRCQHWSHTSHTGPRHPTATGGTSPSAGTPQASPHRSPGLRHHRSPNRHRNTMLTSHQSATGKKVYYYFPVGHTGLGGERFAQPASQPPSRPTSLPSHPRPRGAVRSWPSCSSPLRAS